MRTRLAWAIVLVIGIACLADGDGHTVVPVALPYKQPFAGLCKEVTDELSEEGVPYLLQVTDTKEECIQLCSETRASSTFSSGYETSVLGNCIAVSVTEKILGQHICLIYAKSVGMHSFDVIKDGYDDRQNDTLPPNVLKFVGSLRPVTPLYPDSTSPLLSAGWCHTFTVAGERSIRGGFIHEFEDITIHDYHYTPDSRYILTFSPFSQIVVFDVLLGAVVPEFLISGPIEISNSAMAFINGSSSYDVVYVAPYPEFINSQFRDEEAGPIQFHIPNITSAYRPAVLQMSSTDNYMVECGMPLVCSTKRAQYGLECHLFYIKRENVTGDPVHDEVLATWSFRDTSDYLPPRSYAYERYGLKRIYSLRDKVFFTSGDEFMIARVGHVYGMGGVTGNVSEIADRYTMKWLRWNLSEWDSIGEGVPLNYPHVDWPFVCLQMHFPSPVYGEKSDILACTIYSHDDLYTVVAFDPITLEYRYTGFYTSTLFEPGGSGEGYFFVSFIHHESGLAMSTYSGFAIAFWDSNGTSGSVMRGYKREFPTYWNETTLNPMCPDGDALDRLLQGMYMFYPSSKIAPRVHGFTASAEIGVLSLSSCIRCESGTIYFFDTNKPCRGTQYRFYNAREVYFLNDTVLLVSDTMVSEIVVSRINQGKPDLPQYEIKKFDSLSTPSTLIRVAPDGSTTALLRPAHGLNEGSSIEVVQQARLIKSKGPCGHVDNGILRKSAQGDVVDYADWCTRTFNEQYVGFIERYQLSRIHSLYAGDDEEQCLKRCDSLRCLASDFLPGLGCRVIVRNPITRQVSWERYIDPRRDIKAIIGGDGNPTFQCYVQGTQTPTSTPTSTSTATNTLTSIPTDTLTPTQTAKWASCPSMIYESTSSLMTGAIYLEENLACPPNLDVSCSCMHMQKGPFVKVDFLVQLRLKGNALLRLIFVDNLDQIQAPESKKVWIISTTTGELEKMVATITDLLLVVDFLVTTNANATLEFSVQRVETPKLWLTLSVIAGAWLTIFLVAGCLYNRAAVCLNERWKKQWKAEEQMHWLSLLGKEDVRMQWYRQGDGRRARGALLIIGCAASLGFYICFLAYFLIGHLLWNRKGARPALIVCAWAHCGIASVIAFACLARYMWLPHKKCGACNQPILPIRFVGLRVSNKKTEFMESFFKSRGYFHRRCAKCVICHKTVSTKAWPGACNTRLYHNHCWKKLKYDLVAGKTMQSNASSATETQTSPRELSRVSRFDSFPFSQEERLHKFLGQEPSVFEVAHLAAYAIETKEIKVLRQLLEARPEIVEHRLRDVAPKGPLSNILAHAVVLQCIKAVACILESVPTKDLEMIGRPDQATIVGWQISQAGANSDIYISHPFTVYCGFEVYVGMYTGRYLYYDGHPKDGCSPNWVVAPVLGEICDDSCRVGCVSRNLHESGQHVRDGTIGEIIPPTALSILHLMTDKLGPGAENGDSIIPLEIPQSPTANDDTGCQLSFQLSSSQVATGPVACSPLRMATPVHSWSSTLDLALSVGNAEIIRLLLGDYVRRYPSQRQFKENVYGIWFDCGAETKKLISEASLAHFVHSSCSSQIRRRLRPYVKWYRFYSDTKLRVQKDPDDNGSGLKPLDTRENEMINSLGPEGLSHAHLDYRPVPALMFSSLIFAKTTNKDVLEILIELGFVDPLEWVIHCPHGESDLIDDLPEMQADMYKNFTSKIFEAGGVPLRLLSSQARWLRAFKLSGALRLPKPSMELLQPKSNESTKQRKSTESTARIQEKFSLKSIKLLEDEEGKVKKAKEGNDKVNGRRSMAMSMKKNMHRDGLDCPSDKSDGIMQFYPINYSPSVKLMEFLVDMSDNHHGYVFSESATIRLLRDFLKKCCELQSQNNADMLGITSAGQILAIYAYTYEFEEDSNDQLYARVNRCMREKSLVEVEFWRPFIWYLDQALGSLPSQTFHLYRGIDISFSGGQYKENGTIVWPAYSSASTSRRVAEAFAAGPEGTLFFLTSYNAKDVARFSRFACEGEVLFMPNSKFFVTKTLFSNSAIGGFYTRVDNVEMEEIRRPSQWPSTFGKQFEDDFGIRRPKTDYTPSEFNGAKKENSLLASYSGSLITDKRRGEGKGKSKAVNGHGGNAEAFLDIDKLALEIVDTNEGEKMCRSSASSGSNNVYTNDSDDEVGSSTDPLSTTWAGLLANDGV